MFLLDLWGWFTSTKKDLPPSSPVNNKGKVDAGECSKPVIKEEPIPIWVVLEKIKTEHLPLIAADLKAKGYLNREDVPLYAVYALENNINKILETKTFAYYNRCKFGLNLVLECFGGNWMSPEQKQEIDDIMQHWNTIGKVVLGDLSFVATINARLERVRQQPIDVSTPTLECKM